MNRYIEGIVIHTKRDKKRALIGAILYLNLLARRGTKFCLDSNLKASNKGWTIPINETLFGPKRIWNKPMTLRSNKVKKATESKIKRQWISQLII